MTVERWVSSGMSLRRSQTQSLSSSLLKLMALDPASKSTYMDIAAYPVGEETA
jgi:hypothetical protein